jgi:hypothetical protein
MPIDANLRGLSGALAVGIVEALDADIHVAMPRGGRIGIAVGIFGARHAYAVVATDRTLVVPAADTLTGVLRAGFRAAHGGGIAALTRRTIITLRFTFDAAVELLITGVRIEEAFDNGGASRAERQSHGAQGRLIRTSASPEARRVAGRPSRERETPAKPAQPARARRFATLAGSSGCLACAARIAAAPAATAARPTRADQAVFRQQIEPFPSTAGGYAQRAKDRHERNGADGIGRLTPHLT